MIKHKVAEVGCAFYAISRSDVELTAYDGTQNVEAFLALGPPWPLSPEDAYTARTGAFEALDSFSG